MAGSDEGAMQLRPYNQRIELPNVDDSDGEGGRGGGGPGGGGTGGGGGSGDDDGIHDLDEDELTRDKVKKAASHVRSIAAALRCKYCRTYRWCGYFAVHVFDSLRLDEYRILCTAGGVQPPPRPM